jgi:hypothetical protein
MLGPKKSRLLASGLYATGGGIVLTVDPGITHASLSLLLFGLSALVLFWRGDTYYRIMDYYGLIALYFTGSLAAGALA